MFDLIFSKLLILASDPAILPSFTAYSSINNQPVKDYVTSTSGAKDAVNVYEVFSNYLKLTNDVFGFFRIPVAGFAYLLWVLDEALQWWFFHLFQLFEIQSQHDYGLGGMYNDVCTFGAWLFWAILIIYVLSSMVNAAAGRRYKNILRNMVIIFAFWFMLPKVGQDFGTGISHISLRMGYNNSIGNYATETFQDNVVSIPYEVMNSHPGRTDLLSGTDNTTAVPQKNNGDTDIDGKDNQIYPVILNLQRMSPATRDNFNGLSHLTIGKFLRTYASDEDTLNPNGLKVYQDTFDSMQQWAATNTPDIDNSDHGIYKLGNRIKHPGESWDSFWHSTAHPIKKHEAKEATNARAPILSFLKYHLSTGGGSQSIITENGAFLADNTITQGLRESYAFYHVDWFGVFTQLLMILLIMCMFIWKLFIALFKLVTMYVTTGFILAVNGANHSKVKSWIMNIFSIYEIAIVDLLAMYATLQLVPFMRGAINDISAQTNNWTIENPIILDLVYLLACIGLLNVAQHGLRGLDAQIGPSGGGANSGTAAMSAFALGRIAHGTGRAVTSPIRGGQALLGRRPDNGSGSVYNSIASRNRGKSYHPFNPLAHHRERVNAKHDKKQRKQNRANNKANRQHKRDNVATGSRASGRKLSNAQNTLRHSNNPFKRHSAKKTARAFKKAQKNGGLGASADNPSFHDANASTPATRAAQVRAARARLGAGPSDGGNFAPEDGDNGGQTADDSTGHQTLEDSAITPTSDSNDNTDSAPDFRDSSTLSGQDSPISNDVDDYARPGETPAQTAQRAGKPLVKVPKNDKNRIASGHDSAVSPNETALHAARTKGVQIDSDGNLKYKSMSDAQHHRVNPKFHQGTVSQYALMPDNAGGYKAPNRGHGMQALQDDAIMAYVPNQASDTTSNASSTSDNDNATDDGGSNTANVAGVVTSGASNNTDRTPSSNSVHNIQGQSTDDGQNNTDSEPGGMDTTIRHNQRVHHEGQDRSGRTQHAQKTVTDNVLAHKDGNTKNPLSAPDVKTNGKNMTTEDTGTNNRVHSNTIANNAPSNVTPSGSTQSGTTQAQNEVHNIQGTTRQTGSGNDNGINKTETDVQHNQNVSNEGSFGGQHINHQTKVVTDDVRIRHNNSQPVGNSGVEHVKGRDITENDNSVQPHNSSPHYLMSGNGPLPNDSGSNSEQTTITSGYDSNNITPNNNGHGFNNVGTNNVINRSHNNGPNLKPNHLGPHHR